jgi:CheY-like chemotaxis protein
MISIVDDDLSVREATMGLLRAMGFTAEVFSCPDDFLASELRHNTSCLISDMRMPGMSGLELHNRLIEAGTPVPTILMTAFPNDRDKVRALQAGVVGYLPKPLNETELDQTDGCRQCFGFDLVGIKARRLEGALHQLAHFRLDMRLLPLISSANTADCSNPLLLQKSDATSKPMVMSANEQRKSR